MTPHDPVEARLLSEWHQPEPSAHLRTRVLETFASHGTQGLSWADRLWFSRRWRLAAAAAMVGLLLVERMPVASDSGRGVDAVPATLDAARAAADTAVEVGLTPDQATLLARQMLLGAAMRPSPAPTLYDLATLDIRFP